MIWSLEKRNLPLAFTWKISRNSSQSKTNFFVSVKQHEKQGMGEVAPNIRYDETVERVEHEFLAFVEKVKTIEFQSPEQFSAWLDTLELCHSLRFGIESCYFDWFEKTSEQSLESLLALEKVKLPIPTSFSMPILEISEIEAFLKPLSRFECLKIKVNQESAIQTVMEVKRVTKKLLRIDGNEAFPTAASILSFLEKVGMDQIEFLEQPIPAHSKEEYRKLKAEKLPFPVIADESIENEADFDEIETQFDGINVKLMKAGGYITAVKLLKEAKKRNLKTMIGCMVETSLGIRAALRLCSLADYVDGDGFLLLKEDPFQLVTEKEGKLTFK